jgi:mono/diheme cytochrome c family protein
MMNLAVVLPVLAVLIGLRFVKPSMLGWVAAWWLAAWIVLDFGFSVPIPKTVVKEFMGIISLALAAYVTSDSKRWREVREPTTAFLTERKFLPLLTLVVLAIPAAVAASIYFDMTAPAQAPTFGRTVHPAPPGTLTVHDVTHDMQTLDNPYRKLETSDPEAFTAHVESGRKIYYENCFYCHGDLMQGNGMFAHALNPIPTSFQDSGTIAMLQESYLFWRVAKGGAGLPEEGGPWMSAMPAWEEFLTEEEIWEVILFLYDFTEQRPRALHVASGGEGH